MSIFDRIWSLDRLSPEERMLVNSVAELCEDKIKPRAEHYDVTGSFPGTTYTQLMSWALMVCLFPRNMAELAFPLSPICTASG